jgi:ribonucleoside-diphosphate reductase alpha chain
MGQATNSGVRRFFTQPKSKGYDSITWVKRDSSLKNPFTGEAVFEQKDVEIPEGWSMNALNIVAQKYFTGTPGTAERESSLKHLIDRVVDTTVRHGQQEGYFDSATEAETFREELKFILATQRAAFNSPVLFLVLRTVCRQFCSGTSTKA